MDSLIFTTRPPLRLAPAPHAHTNVLRERKKIGPEALFQGCLEDTMSCTIKGSKEFLATEIQGNLFSALYFLFHFRRGKFERNKFTLRKVKPELYKRKKFEMPNLNRLFPYFISFKVDKQNYMHLSCMS